MHTEKAGFWLRVSALIIDEVILVSTTFVLLILIKPLLPLRLIHSICFLILFYEHSCNEV